MPVTQMWSAGVRGCSALGQSDPTLPPRQLHTRLLKMLACRLPPCFLSAYFHSPCTEARFGSKLSKQPKQPQGAPTWPANSVRTVVSAITVGSTVPSSMPFARARSVSGLVSVASTVRSMLVHVSVAPHVLQIGGRHWASIVQKTLAVALQCGWNGTLSLLAASGSVGSDAPRTTTHAPLGVFGQWSCATQSGEGGSSQSGGPA